MRPALLAAALAFAALPVIAQTPSGMGRPMLHGNTDTPVAPGRYGIEPAHTQVTFAVAHLGISPYAGTFSEASGTLDIDPAHPDAAKVSISIPIASVMTTSAKLTDELKGGDWFDAAKFPTATFVSSKVTPMGQTAAIDGMLTLHGVTKPVTIYAKLFGAGVNPMDKSVSVGFVARAGIKRSDFGVSKYIPLVSDEVELVINAAFEKK